MGKHQVIKNVALILVSAAFGLLTMEGLLAWKPALQVQFPLENLVFCGDPPRKGREHSQLGWTAEPGSAFFVQKSEADGWTVYINNAQGFRDLYDSGSRHVIVLGDSFTEGVNANNDEAFPHLLDLWNPNVAFHNFGMSGYGTSNALAVYRAVSADMPHDLVILAYFLGNDLRDNLTRQGQPQSPDEVEGDTWYEFLQDANSRIRQHWRTYNLLYKALRPHFGEGDLSETEIREGIRITDSLLSALVTQVKSNGADLLVVALPSWNQIKGHSDPNEMEQQRLLLQKYADGWDNVYLLDVSAEFNRAGVDGLYGSKDKHFSPLGYYTTARLVHDWINADWPNGDRTAIAAPAFQPRVTAVDPDCASITDYREAFANPTRDWGRLTAER